jgi:hypothetical protein
MVPPVVEVIPHSSATTTVADMLAPCHVIVRVWIQNVKKRVMVLRRQYNNSTQVVVSR